MSFATPTFLWFFMPATLALYWLLPPKARNGLLAIASLVFYSWGGHGFVFLLLACITVNYFVGRSVDADRPTGATRKQVALIVAIVVDLGALAIWKYADFASRQANSIAHASYLDSLAAALGVSQ